jgi:hypothetical protein
LDQTYRAETVSKPVETVEKLNTQQLVLNARNIAACNSDSAYVYADIAGCNGTALLVSGLLPGGSEFFNSLGRFDAAARPRFSAGLEVSELRFKMSALMIGTA